MRVRFSNIITYIYVMNVNWFTNVVYVNEYVMNDKIGSELLFKTNLS